MLNFPNPPRLKVGQRCRLAEGGPVYTVERVTDCAAALATRVRRVFQALDKKTGEMKEVIADGRELTHVSPYSFVLHVA